MRIDLQPYAERCEIADHVAMTLYRYIGDDTSAVHIARAVLGENARKHVNEREILRYTLRHGLFRVAWQSPPPLALLIQQRISITYKEPPRFLIFQHQLTAINPLYLFGIRGIVIEIFL